MNELTLIRGGLAVDDRGSVSFVNDFAFDEVKRFYVIENHQSGFIRAWHGHKHEKKFLSVLKGSALVCAVEIDDWDHPDEQNPIHRFTLSESLPSVLAIPNGYANGFMSLTEDTKLVVFCSSSLEESSQDDYRFDAHYWDPWKIEER